MRPLIGMLSWAAHLDLGRGAAGNGIPAPKGFLQWHFLVALVHQPVQFVVGGQLALESSAKGIFADALLSSWASLMHPPLQRWVDGGAGPMVRGWVDGGRARVAGSNNLV